MYEEQASLFYYLTVGNEPYVIPSIPNEDVKEGILKGMYKYKGAEINKTNLHAELLGSSSILNEVLKAGQILEYQYNVATDVWSVTSL
jgi:pyruvate dehydrogenase E1 component